MARVKKQKDVVNEIIVTDIPEFTPESMNVSEPLPEDTTVTFTAIATEVKPFAANNKGVEQTYGKVKLVKNNGRIIAQAVSKSTAERMVKNNPSLKIVE